MPKKTKSINNNSAQYNKIIPNKNILQKDIFIDDSILDITPKKNSNKKNQSFQPYKNVNLRKFGAYWLEKEFDEYLSNLKEENTKRKLIKQIKIFNFKKNRMHKVKDYEKSSINNSDFYSDSLHSSFNDKDLHSKNKCNNKNNIKEYNDQALKKVKLNLSPFSNSNMLPNSISDKNLSSIDFMSDDFLFKKDPFHILQKQTFNIKAPSNLNRLIKTNLSIVKNSTSLDRGLSDKNILSYENHDYHNKDKFIKNTFNKKYYLYEKKVSITVNKLKNNIKYNKRKFSSYEDNFKDSFIKQDKISTNNTKLINNYNLIKDQKKNKAQETEKNQDKGQIKIIFNESFPSSDNSNSNNSSKNQHIKNDNLICNKDFNYASKHQKENDEIYLTKNKNNKIQDIYSPEKEFLKNNNNFFYIPNKNLLIEYNKVTKYKFIVEIKKNKIYLHKIKKINIESFKDHKKQVKIIEYVSSSEKSQLVLKYNQSFCCFNCLNKINTKIINLDKNKKIISYEDYLFLNKKIFNSEEIKNLKLVTKNIDKKEMHFLNNNEYIPINLIKNILIDNLVDHVIGFDAQKDLDSNLLILKIIGE